MYLANTSTFKLHISNFHQSLPRLRLRLSGIVCVTSLFVDCERFSLRPGLDSDVDNPVYANAMYMRCDSGVGIPVLQTR